MSSTNKSSQGRSVEKELEVLRLKHLARNQRDKLKDGALILFCYVF